MHLFALLLIVGVALLHLWFLVLEMVFWTHPLGIKVFGLKPEFAEATRVLAANQGLYNGFLAAGLLWGVKLSLLAPRIDITNLAGHARAVQLFFLSCVIIAGIFGAATVNRKIFFVQALPAIAATALTLWA